MKEGGFPKDYRENLEWRRGILRRAKRDVSYRAKVKELFHRDVLFAFNAFFLTLDVRRRPEHDQPFCTYPYQDFVILDLVKHINEGKDIPIEKSRDMGASWMIILIFLWFWLDSTGGADFLVGSRIEDYVDKKGDMRTLIEKARYALKRLPYWLKPKGFQVKHHDNFMKLQNPETGASITGESNNPNFSTGGRYLAILFDEFAKWKDTDESAWTASGDATPCRIPNSTPFGAAGKYYDLIHEASNKLRLHWSLHPRKAKGAYCRYPRTSEEEEYETPEELERLIRSPWYDAECARRRPTEIAQELDIDYIGAGNPAFEGKAGKRVATLLRRPRTPETWYNIDLGAMELKEVNEPRDKEDFLVVYRKPDPKTTYTFGVDVVEGVEGGDYAVIKVVNRITKDVDASYYSRIDEVQLARIITITAKFYTTFEAPWVGIETIGPGLATFDFCAELFDVDNLFMSPNYDSAKESVSWKKGFRTTSSSRNRLISGVTDWLIDGSGWADARCCREFTTFVRNKSGKPEAKSGANDDEVLAFGIAIQVDLLAPEDKWEKKKETREDGLPTNIFELETLATKGEPTTLEERCLASLLAKRSDNDEVMFFTDDSTETFNVMVEDG